MYYPVIIATHLPSTVCNIYFIVNHISQIYVNSSRNVIQGTTYIFLIINFKDSSNWNKFYNIFFFCV